MAGRILAIAVTCGALWAPNALAAANHTGTLGQIGDTFEWSDNNNRAGLGSGLASPPVDMCADPGWPCDTTLFHLTTSGELNIEVHDTGLARPDVDIYLYASDASGAVGDELGYAVTPEADEAMPADLEPGYYLLQVAYYSGVMNNSTGKATLTELPAPVDDEDS